MASLPAVNVVHVSATDGTGGASRAARRLHEGLRDRGIGSRMAVGQIAAPADEVGRITDAPGVPIATALRAERLAVKLSRFTGEVALPFPSSWALEHTDTFQWADVIHLHNLHGSYFDHRVLPRWSRARPLVWTLHDMWPLTGHCAYSYECERWRTGCGPCPLFSESRKPYDDIPQPPWDNSGPGWRRKRRLYGRTPVAVVAPSRWLVDLARESILGIHPDTSFHHIPYGLDTDLFAPVRKEDARRELGLAPDASVVLFGAATLAQERKGIRHLVSAMRDPRMAGSPVTLLVFGSATGVEDALPGARALGAVSDPAAQVTAYSAADVAVVPSLADNQPLVALEALACGTPVVGAAAGGIPEIVRDLETGLCVPPGSAEALAGAITQLITNPELRERLSEGARRYAVETHSLDRCASRYAELYAEVSLSSATRQEP